MSRKPRELDRDRRRLLRGLMVTGGLAAAAGAAGARAAVASVETVRPDERRGYRVTAHVSRYYERARF